jgi:membrane-associated protease RseP (regulator of RpoE activity)
MRSGVRSGGGAAPPGSPGRPPLIELVPAPGGGWAVDARRLPRPQRPRWGLAAALFAATLLTTTTLGAVWGLWTRTDTVTDALPLFTPDTVATVWSDPDLLALGFSFSLPALAILLCHELGHYLACRRYRLPATPPFFLPAPFGVGTLGAFIRIKAPIRTKRELFDVGIWGPIAGFAALVPFLLIGVARSTPAPLARASFEQASGILYLPGDCLAVRLATAWSHGPLPDGTVLDLHPFALAAWFGLLATSINLLPLGQLDGGHVLYASTGSLQRRLALPLWLGLAAAGFAWAGWWLWCGIVLLMGLYHPPVSDESEPLGAGRRALAWVALAILLLSFMPVPLREIPVH